MAGEGKDPLVQFSYALDLGGKVKGYFTECSGLGSEHDVVEHKVVDEKGRQMIKMVPGRIKWDKITLKRGITDAKDIWDWRKKVEDGQVEDARIDGSIIMMDQELKPVARWNFEGGWPSKVSGPQLKSASNEIGVEELTIVHHRLERVQ
jgi:phage tail-like protein